MRRLSKIIFLLIALSSFATQVTAQAAGSSEKKSRELKSSRVRDVILHYVESGRGVPVILVHGSLDDYRLWEPHIDPFAEKYHVIAYSRRYNYPNKNQDIPPDHSAIVEADDLAGLIKNLKLPAAHIVGHSYGALTALFLALRHPGLVRTLVLAEPPVLRLIQDRSDGKSLYDTFINSTWKPVGEEFRKGEREKAMRLTLKYFLGEDLFDQIPERQRNYWMENIREWHALTTSRDAFPPVSRSRIRSIKVPVMMLSGGRTLAILKVVDQELESVLANVERVVLQDATHEMWAEQPEESRRVVLSFINKR
jgi:pimeloyl-ACP methyl ester carboxylesterase